MHNELLKELAPILKQDKGWWARCKQMGLTRQQIGEVRAFIDHHNPINRNLVTFLVEEYRRMQVQVQA